MERIDANNRDNDVELLESTLPINGVGHFNFKTN